MNVAIGWNKTTLLTRLFMLILFPLIYPIKLQTVCICYWITCFPLHAYVDLF